MNDLARYGLEDGSGLNISLCNLTVKRVILMHDVLLILVKPVH